MKIILRFVLPFVILLGLFTSNDCIAKSNSGNTASKVVTLVTIDNAVLYSSPILDSYSSDFIVTENVKEDDSFGLAPLKSNFLLTANLSISNFSETAGIKVNNKHLVLGSMVPVRNIPRYILFHSLQINF